MRVALDTNVLVAAFATRGLCADLVRAVIAEHELVLGPAVRSELRRVLEGKLGIPGPQVQEIDSFLDTVAPPATVPAAAGDRPRGDMAGFAALEARDPDDVRVVEEAWTARADVLVSGPTDLLQAARGLPIPVLSPREFWTRLRQL